MDIMKYPAYRVVWITGASSGIGEALVHAFARLGAMVVLSARRGDRLEEVRAAAGLDDENSMTLPLDITQIDTFEEKARQVIEEFGRIDLLINNAGVSQRARALDTPMRVFRQVMEVNFFGQIGLAKSVLPHMIRQGSGMIAVTSSVVGKYGSAKRSAYSASKHALHGFFDSLRIEHHKDGLRVLLVCPGFIKTEVLWNALDKNGKPYRRYTKEQTYGLPVEYCAERIVRAIRKGREEVYIGGFWELFGVYAKRFWPWLVSKLLRTFPTR